MLKMKNWQDKWISIGTWIFGFVLIPQLIAAYNGNPASVLTSGGTAIILWSFAITFATLKMKLTSIANIFTASMWTLIAIFSYMT